MVVCLERGANGLHMVQLMPLPPIISSFIKIQIGLIWCRLTQVVLEKRPLNGCLSSTMFVIDLVCLVGYAASVSGKLAGELPVV